MLLDELQDKNLCGRRASQQSQDLSITELSGGESSTLQQISSSCPEQPQSIHPVTLLNNAEDPLRKEHAQLVKNGRVVAGHIVRANVLAQDIETALRRGLEEDSLSISVDRLAQDLHGWSSINSVSIAKHDLESF